MPELRGNAVALRVLAVFCMAAMSAVIHGISDRMPLGQMIAGRAGFSAPVIVLIMVIGGQWPQALRTAHPGLHLTRSLFGVMAMALSFVSLTYLPVAQAEALAYTAPVFSIALAAIMLSERVDARGVAAMGLGLCGVAVLTGAALERPGQGAVIGIAAGLGFALTSAFVRVHMKGMTATERPETIALYFSMTGCVLGLATLPFAAQTMSGGTWAWLAAAGCLGAFGHVLAAQALKLSTVTRLAPLDFTGLGWAVIFDVLAFGTRPTVVVACGLVLITASAWVARRGRADSR